MCCTGRTVQMKLVYYNTKVSWGLESVNKTANMILTLDGHSIHVDQFSSLLALKACLLVFCRIQ